MRTSTGAPWLLAASVLMLGACESTDEIIGVDPGGAPAAPRNVQATYFDQAVFITWELAPAWDGEAFRIYSKRRSDPSFFLIAEVTNCSGGLCSYTDTNLLPGITYEYFVAAVDPVSGVETASAFFVEVFVPQPIPPPVPDGVEVVGLDGATFVRWGDNARSAADFSFYRVYLAGADGTDFLLGETDSEGFLDLLAENGSTFDYFVTAVDVDGHESQGSVLASGTPRPDFTNEWVWDFFDVPALSGFRFQNDETTDPIVAGDDPLRDFRLERDADGWWLVPGPDAEVFPQAFETTALKCGPGADAGCIDLDTAPTSGYTTAAVELVPQLTYVLRVPGGGGEVHFGAIRVTLLGFDQNGDGIMIFDWAFQLQPGNPGLSPTTTDVRGG